MTGQKIKPGRIFFNIVMIGLFLCLSGAPQMVQAAVSVLSAPGSVKTVSSSYNSITVSWNSVKGADGYLVYRAVSKNGTYSLVKGTTLKSYKNTALTTGKTYYYKIRAYKKSKNSKLYGKYSAIKSAKPVAAVPGSVSAAATSYNTIKVSWKPVAGASGYCVYTAASSTGTYSLIKTTTGSSYSNTGRTTGSTYYYKVRAYTTVKGTKVFGSYTKAVNATPALAKPVPVIAASSKDGTIDISWTAIAGANGYEIRRAEPNSQEYALLATSSDTVYSDTKITPENTYYYKIRAYRTVGKGKVYSSYSTGVKGIVHVINITDISLDKSEDTLILGNSDKLEVLIAPAGTTNPSVIWESSDDTVVTVDEEGNLTSINAGTAVITVTTEDGSMASECVVTVNNAAIKGIDVSKWQKTIDWAAVKSDGIEFAMIRATYGSSSIDPMFETNYNEAKENDIAVGVYHYSYATTVATAAAEVKFLISKLNGKQLEYPICVDVEDSSQSSLSKKTLTDIVITYLTELENAGYYPMIYANAAWYTGKLDNTRLLAYDHWLAQWGNSITYTGSVNMWQYSSTGIISGISGNVDLDISFVDYEARIKQLKMNGF